MIWPLVFIWSLVLLGILASTIAMRQIDFELVVILIVSGFVSSFIPIIFCSLAYKQELYWKDNVLYFITHMPGNRTDKNAYSSNTYDAKQIHYIIKNITDYQTTKKGIIVYGDITHVKLKQLYSAEHSKFTTCENVLIPYHFHDIQHLIDKLAKERRSSN